MESVPGRPLKPFVKCIFVKNNVGAPKMQKDFLWAL